MTSLARSLLALLLGSAVALTPACAKKETPATPAAAPAKAPTKSRGHPLKGVIVDILPQQSALLVKHEDIPGFMPAMTMMFKVDDATLRAAQKNQAITGTLVEGAEGLSLVDVKPVGK